MNINEISTKIEKKNQILSIKIIKNQTLRIQFSQIVYIFLYNYQ